MGRPQNPAIEALPQPANQDFTLRSGDTLYMANGLLPIGSKQLEIDGTETEVDMVGLIRLSGWQREDDIVIALTQAEGDPESPLIAHRISDLDGHAVSTASRDLSGTDPITLNTKNGTLKLVSDPKKHRGWLGLSVSGPNLKNATVIVSDAATPQAENYFQAAEKRRNIKRGKRLGAVALSLFSAYSAVKPGGIQDSYWTIAMMPEHTLLRR